jgi:hypothetical protein
MDSRRNKKHRSYAEPPRGSNAGTVERPHLQDRAYSASVVTNRRQSQSKSYESLKASSPSDRGSKGSRRDDPPFPSHQSSRLTGGEKLKAVQPTQSREDVCVLPYLPKTTLLAIVLNVLQMFCTDIELSCRLVPKGCCLR